MIELPHLRHIVAVAEELHFARAAERLRIEQSPLSQSIRNVESELQVQLLHRTTCQTWLSKAGTRFYEDAKRILADVDEAAAGLKRESGDTPPVVRLALGEDLAGEGFTRLLFELEHHASPTDVEVRELTHLEAARLVRDGGADVALTFDRRPVDGMRQRRAWAETLMLVVAIAHPLAKRDQVGLTEIATERLALPRRDMCPGYLAQIEALFARHTVPLANRVLVRSWNTAVSFAATGNAVALCPTTFVNGTTSVATIPINSSDAELVTWLVHPDAKVSSAVSLVVELAALIDRGPEALVGEGAEP